MFKISDKDFAVIQKLNMRSAWVWWATWMGAGFLRPAPGTWGSLAALPFGVFIIYFTGWLGLLFCTSIVTVIGVWATRKFEETTGEHDSKMIVIDEVAGQWLTLMPVAIFFPDLNGYAAMSILAAFLLFRAFDITKPWPACYFDKDISNAYGVMGDDIVAGLYAGLVLTLGIVYAGFS